MLWYDLTRSKGEARHYRSLHQSMTQPVLVARALSFLPVHVRSDPHRLDCHVSSSVSSSRPRTRIGESQRSTIFCSPGFGFLRGPVQNECQ